MRWRVAKKVLSQGVAPEGHPDRRDHRVSTVDRAVVALYRIVRRDDRRRRRRMLRVLEASGAALVGAAQAIRAAAEEAARAR